MKIIDQGEAQKNKKQIQKKIKKQIQDRQEQERSEAMVL